ncbi:MAG: methyltransferase domain-containing protein [Bacteroidota bacterium]
MMSLRTRSAELEIMDDLNCHGEVVDQTLRELEVINRLLGGDYVTIDGIKKLLKEKRSYTVADMGCGGGDLGIKIERWGRKHGFDLSVTGIDANPNIIDFARRQYPENKFEALDVFSDEFRKKQFDIITATLFVHHLDDEQLVELFRSLKARVGVVINDIHRHSLSYYSIKLLTQLFSKSAMVKFDAPLSVRRAFKRKELIAILDKAGIKSYTLRWKWAFRWQLVWHNFY